MMRLSLVCLFVCMWRVVWWCWLLMYVRGAVCVRVLLWLCAGVKILCAGWRITIWAPGEGNERPWMCPFAWLSLYQISRAALIVLIALAKSGVSQTKKKGVLRKMQQKKRKSQTNKAKRESEKKIIVSTRDVISLCLLWEIHIVRFRHFVVPFCLPFKKATKPCEGTPNTQKNIFTLHNPHFFFPFHLKFLSRRFKTTSTVPKAYFGAAQFSEGSSGLGQGCGYCAVITMCAPPQRCFEKNCRRWCWLQKSRGQSGTIWIWNSKRGWSDSMVFLGWVHRHRVPTQDLKYRRTATTLAEWKKEREPGSSSSFPQTARECCCLLWGGVPRASLWFGCLHNCTF